MEWLVLYTKPQFEIKLEALNLIGIQAYCPFTHMNSILMKEKVVKPLLPSYIFVKIEEKIETSFLCSRDSKISLAWKTCCC